MPTDNQSRATMHYSGGEKPGAMEIRGQFDWTLLAPGEVGQVLTIGADGQPAWGSSVDASWPVGSVFISVVSTNPSTLLGGGTWEQIAEGRTLIGQDPGQSEYDTAEETGGSETHGHDDHGSLSHSGTAVANHASHTHDEGASVQVPGGGSVADAWDAASSSTAESSTLTHSVTQPDSHTGLSHSSSNHVPPYFVTYIWKRTA